MKIDKFACNITKNILHHKIKDKVFSKIFLHIFYYLLTISEIQNILDVLIFLCFTTKRLMFYQFDIEAV